MPSPPVFPSQPGEFLAALATIMPVGTPVVDVLIQKGLSSLAGTFPVLILNCPLTEWTRKANHAKQNIFTIHGLYLDRWETDTRTFEQILADMSTALGTMGDNVNANYTLNMGPTVTAGEKGSIRINGPVDTRDIGVPLVSGEITIQVKGPWYIAT
jgi:hypothetical protein